jgi:hypothetical protein
MHVYVNKTQFTPKKVELAVKPRELFILVCLYMTIYSVYPPKKVELAVKLTMALVCACDVCDYLLGWWLEVFLSYYTEYVLKEGT